MEWMKSAFESRFGRRADVASSAPGRINIIGEHTDYNDGYVLPAAIDRRIHFLAAKRNDGRIFLWSENFYQSDEFDAALFSKTTRRPWSNYVRGVVHVLGSGGRPRAGFDGWLCGDVPIGAGLSSSAALEISVLSGMNLLFDLGLDPMRMAVLGQMAESEFVGMRCGLMDQFISVFGQPDSAVFLDCMTQDYEVLPFALRARGLSLLVCDTRVKRELAGSDYNRRREEAEAALKALGDSGVRSYRDVSVEILERHRSDMPEMLYRRARHVHSENSRVLSSVKYLKNLDFEALGEQLFASHRSLRDDYQVSSPELDLLHDCGRGFSGCLGARMTGAGFGGSGIAVVRQERTEAFQAWVMEEFAKRKFRAPVFYEMKLDRGSTAERLA